MTSIIPMQIHEEVKAAIVDGRGVVALESTVIAHGLPFPDNLKIAHDLDAVVRTEGSVPAMIAIIDGVLRVGLDQQSIERLAQPNAAVRKVSRRDIAYTIASKLTGATTVSATMIAAHMVGIRIFATGGLGGVHRGAEVTMDVSADLMELSKTPVAVVCAGAKSILDIPKTLEMLETLGVPIFGYRTVYFPEFYCPGNRHLIEMMFDNVEEIATALQVHWSLGLRSGTVVAQPIPEEDALPNEWIEDIIKEASKLAKKSSVTGKNLTPFLLNEISISSGAKSIQSNKALLINNARLAAQIARAICVS